MKLVVLESPYAPKERYGTALDRQLHELEENRRYARLCMRDCLLRGEAPFASHLLYTQDGVLDDTKPEERKLGIKAGLEWAKCRSGFNAGQTHNVVTVVYRDLGVSEGMGLGIQHAIEHGRLVEHRTLPGWDGWKAPQDPPKPEVFKPVPKCGDSGCYLPAVHCEHYYEQMRYWCEQHTPWSGHYEYCGAQCIALKSEVDRRLFNPTRGLFGPPSGQTQRASDFAVALHKVLYDVVEVVNCTPGRSSLGPLWVVTANGESGLFSVQCQMEEGTQMYSTKALKQVNRTFRSYLESRENNDAKETIK